MDRFEYLRRPLTTDTTPADLDLLGRDGWELCAIENGIGWFRRSSVARELREQAERQIGG
jgi:hypothetical protein